jgi:mannosyltransferase
VNLEADEPAGDVRAGAVLATASRPIAPPVDKVAVEPEHPRRGGRLDVLTVLFGLAAVAGLLLRLWPRSALWLDEAQTVAFAREPLLRIPSLLRTDGAPPLYYLMLHLWMAAFGSSTFGVRLFSVLCSVALVPVLALAARRYGGRAAVVPCVVLVAMSPFAIRYGTEARMYSLLMLLVGLLLLAVPWAVDRPGPRRAAVVALLAGSLLYTHYWALYLLAAGGVALAAAAWRWRSTARGAGCRWVLAGLAGGVVLWLPWVPSFLYQAANTGTPWAPSPSPSDVLNALPALAGGDRMSGIVLAIVLLVALLMALFARPVDAWRTELQWRPNAPAWLLVIVVVLSPSLAAAGGMLSGSAFVPRYNSVVFPVLVLVAAIGIGNVGGRPAKAVILGLACMAALPMTIDDARTARTPATSIAHRLEAQAEPGDVVVFCPDQLGPAVSRILESDDVHSLQEGVFPDWSSPDRVDWVHYEDRYQDGSPSAFAAEADRRAGSGSVWVVWSALYPPTESACTGLREALTGRRPVEQRIVADLPDDYLDHGALLRFPAESARNRER